MGVETGTKGEETFDAYMEGLTVSLGVGLVALDLAAAEEAGVGGRGGDGIVLAQLPGDCLGQRGDVLSSS